MFNTILLSVVWLFPFDGKTPAPIFPIQTSAESFKCFLPVPKNIQPLLLSTTFIQFSWDPVPEAAYFRVKVFNEDGTMRYSELVAALPEKNGVVIENLEPGATVGIIVHSVCSNGVESPKAK
ncbi:MAG: hypothetical protein H7246_07640 [Phycisphaerae bacterium]|nr:hypothetical protein [Saprospiraceae bacterium]